MSGAIEHMKAAMQTKHSAAEYAQNSASDQLKRAIKWRSMQLLWIETRPLNLLVLVLVSRGANKDKISVSISFHNYIDYYFVIFLMKFVIL